MGDMVTTRPDVQPPGGGFNIYFAVFSTQGPNEIKKEPNLGHCPASIN